MNEAEYKANKIKYNSQINASNEKIKEYKALKNQIKNGFQSFYDKIDWAGKKVEGAKSRFANVLYEDAGTEGPTGPNSHRKGLEQIKGSLDNMKKSISGKVVTEIDVQIGILEKKISQAKQSLQSNEKSWQNYQANQNTK